MDVQGTDDGLRPGAELAWLGASASTYPRGAELFHQGQMLAEVMQIVAGIVKLTRSDADGGESIVGLAMDGEWIGTAPVIANRPAPVSAVTCASTVVRRVSGRAFRQQLQHGSQLSYEIHAAHSSELCRQTTRIGQLCSLPSFERLRCALCRLSSTVPVASGSASIRLQLPLLHWELAAFIGVTPEHLSRLLKDMESGELIRREKGWIVIRDPARLCQDCDGGAQGRRPSSGAV